MEFKNDSSHCRFIGNRDLAEVIAQDAAELKELGGSFDAIGDRMQGFLDFLKPKGYLLTHEELTSQIGELLNQFRKRYGEDFQNNKQAWEEYGRQWAERLSQNEKTHYDNHVSVIQGVTTRGIQVCPFEGCKAVWSEDVHIYDRTKKRPLTVNKGTVHLARMHHLLEKGNEYGISAREFYESFM